MNDDEEFEYDEEERVRPCRRLQRADLGVLGLHLVHGVLRAFADTAALALQCAVGHANHNVEQQQFHEDAAREIEAITRENDS